MSMVRKVAAIIAQRGPSTLDDIAPLFPEIQRATVQKALGNCKTLGLLTSQPVLKKGSWGSPMAVYVATHRATEPPPPKNGYRPKSGSHMAEMEALIDEYQPCTIDSLMEHTTMTREQAQNAASALVFERRICIAERGVNHGRAEDRRPSTYKIVERQPHRGGQFWQRQIASVFDLGRMA